MLVLIVLILLGVAVIALASVAVVRSPRATEVRKDRKVQDRGSQQQGESEVYERLYGKRSTTVSAGVPVERPRSEPDADGRQAGSRDRPE